MDERQIKTLIKTFIAERKRLVLATVDGDGMPEAALVAYGDTPAGELVIGTSSNSRKYANILKHGYAAVVVGWEAGQSVQLEGGVRVLPPKEYEEYIDYHFTKNPDAERYRDMDEQVYLLFTPVWARYVDISTQPETRHEVSYR